MKRIPPFLIPLFLSLTSLWGEGNVLLQWEPWEGALHYEVELKWNGTDLFAKQTKEPELYLDLGPGEYAYRVNIYNKFNKIAVQSDWIPLSIIKSLEPRLIAREDRILYGYDKRQSLIVEGVEIMEGARFFLLSPDDREIPLPYENLSRGRFRLIVDTVDLSPGSYAVRVLNPSGTETTREDFLFLRQKEKPLFGEILPHQALRNQTLPEVFIHGEKFDKNIIVYLIDRDGHPHLIPVNNVSDDGRELSLWMDLTGVKKGYCDLQLINPPYEETYVEDAFFIMEAGEIRDASFYEEIRWGTDLLLGIPLPDLLYDVPLTSLTFLEEDFLHYFPEGELLLRLDLTGSSPFFSLFGLESRLAFLLPYRNQEMNVNTVNVGLYGRTRFNGPINLLAHGDLGYRILSSRGTGYHGWLLTLGGGLQLNYDRWLIELDGRMDYWMIQSGVALNLTQVSLRTGYRF